MRLLRILQHSFDFWFLLGTSFCFFLLRLPSFFEPYWYGDEGVYEVLGFGIRHGRLLYQGVWDNKPPLLYVLYALVDGNQPAIRLLSFFVGLLSVFLFYFLAKRLFQQKKNVYIAVGFFALFLGLPFLEGNIANAENFMILPSVGAMFLIIKTIQEKKLSFISLFSAGLFLGISFLIKVVAVFDFATVFFVIIFLFFAWNKKTIQQLVTKFFVFAIGFILPLLATIGFFVAKGALHVFIQSAFLSNISYVNYGNQFIIPQGFLIAKLILLGVILSLIFIKRKSLSLTEIFIYSWFAFSLFNAFFSQRPFTHYLLVLLASLALFVGMLFEKKLQRLHGAILVIVFVLLAKNFWFYGNTVFYYGNFFTMLSGQKTVTDYQSFFDKGVPRDYAIADYLNKHMAPNQKVFLWTNSAQIYYLIKKLPIGRYTVAYHMTLSGQTLNETALALQETKPQFVVILPNATPLPFHMTDYHLKAVIQDGLIYERIL